MEGTRAAGTKAPPLLCYAAAFKCFFSSMHTRSSFEIIFCNVTARVCFAQHRMGMSATACLCVRENVVNKRRLRAQSNREKEWLKLLIFKTSSPPLSKLKKRYYTLFLPFCFCNLNKGSMENFSTFIVNDRTARNIYLLKPKYLEIKI
jgi:hypothetical protein